MLIQGVGQWGRAQKFGKKPACIILERSFIVGNCHNKEEDNLNSYEANNASKDNAIDGEIPRDNYRVVKHNFTSDFKQV